MKSTYSFASLLLLLLLMWLSFFTLMPPSGTPASLPEEEFSTERAFAHLREIAREPHMIGSPENTKVREYIVGALQDLGLETQIQEGFVLNSSWGSLDKPVNILARIEGTKPGKALLVFSHYDSALVPSLGASDAGSGVVTILESLRAFLSRGVQPTNDIIIMFTDGEEVGLDGAKLFVREHPWAADVAIALNFEARGSGGASNMIVETNHGNSGLIKAFKAADIDYPVASSLMYSIYKMLPNDTDSTILREEGDIDGYFFAFIDDHFDYHTANDKVDNLDENTLQHQGEYLLPMLNYLADADLDLRSDTDDVYTNLPFMGLISYPFSWILPMLLLAVLLFVLVVYLGISRGTMTLMGCLRGFVPFLLTLVSCGLLGYFGWQVIEAVYPHYDEIQHGFTYNGYTYITAFVLLSFALALGMYHRFGRSSKISELLFSPILIWLIVNALIWAYLKGAAYFIIPTFLGLLAMWIATRQERPNLILMVLISAPAVFIFLPLAKSFPVGLGLEMMVAATIFIGLLFGLLLPVAGYYRFKKFLGVLCLIAGVVFLFRAHLQSNFTAERQKPNSLIFYQDQDQQKAYWVTYDKILDDWTRGYLGEEPETASKYVVSAAGSKYNSGYTFASPSDTKDILALQAILDRDTLIGQSREVRLVLKPRTNTRLMRLYADKELSFQALSYNGKQVPPDSLGRIYHDRKSNYLLQYYVPEGDSLVIDYTLPDNSEEVFTVLDYSFDLMQHPLFSVDRRPDYTMPKPFVTTDAVLLRQSIDVNSLRTPLQDSLSPASE
jgi:hypothetical protein